MSESDARREELLALLLEAEGLTAPHAPDGPVRSGRTQAPLTSAQARVWFQQQLDPDGTAANLRAGMRIVGPFDRDRLSKACAVIAEHHEALRTTYHPDGVDGAPIQVVHDELAIDVEFIDLLDGAAADSPTARQSGTALDRAIAAVQIVADRPFDLERAAPLRIAIARLAPHEHLVAVIVHHIACDDLTWEILLPDLAAAYRGEQLGAPAHVQPVDFAIWERDQLQADAFAADLAHWRQRLLPLPAGPRLPFDRRRTPNPAADAGFVQCPMPTGLAKRIADYARERAVSPFVVLLAGFAATLSRVTGDNDIAVASPTVLRELAQLERVVGNFLNTLVFRINVPDELTFDELIDRVHESVGADLEHGAVPFDRVVEHLRPHRLPGRHPLADVMFLVYRPTTVGVSFPGADVHEVALHPGMSGFDLTVTVLQDGATLVPGAFYRRECFDPETVSTLLEVYLSLLERAIDRPASQVSQLPLQAARGHRTLVDAVIGKSTDLPRLTATTLVDGFARSVAEHPDRVAVRAEDGALTYRELNARADELAAALRDAGVESGARVGVALPRETGLIIAVIAVCKTGAAYVPVDPTGPVARSRSILHTARLSAIIGSSEMAPAVPDGVPLVPVDATGTAALNPHAPAADSVAYIIHTSGSTGEPKGVVVTHANVMRLFSSLEHLFTFSHHDVWSMAHEAAFDFSVWEMWGALLYGGAVVLVPKTTTRAPDEFVRLLRREKVTVLSQTPRAFALLAAAEREDPGLADLRLVVFGGEALEAASLSDWFERHPDAPRMVNMYGLTESTVHTTYLELSPATAATMPGAPIGVPLPDLEVELRDVQRQPVPDGVVAEMYVRGPGVASGYFDRPDLTADRFVDGWYRTGDLARRRRDGCLEFLGRADQQVKVRGYRVELGEIEAALRRHAAQAAVIADGDRLVAHVVGATTDLSRLRSVLSTYLPEHMLPAAFIEHDRLPLTPNGKLDTRALAAAVPDTRQPPQGAERLAEINDDLQRSIAAIWADALDVTDVGVDENFFDLGGHSLLLATIRPLIENAAGQAVPILDLYTHPTIRALCVHLRATPGAGIATETVGDERASRQRAAIRARRQKGRA